MLINELHRYLIIPKIIVTTSKKDLAYEAIQYDVTDYILKPWHVFYKVNLKVE
jgi:response regulator of citrate/malate metabolism